MDAVRMRAEALTKAYRVGDLPLFLIGTFEKGVTVYSQQSRALNLAWALVESDVVQCIVDPAAAFAEPPLKIAIVGGGFAGLSVAAALIRKRAWCDITLFEERDTLLPLQQGSDTRWLHPRIYDWPGKGSDANVAMLPVLNWSAARASDVVVQILTEWRSVVSDWTEFLERVGYSTKRELIPKLFCNSRHLQVHVDGGDNSHVRLEWIGERRDINDANSIDHQRAAVGSAEKFDLVLLTVGYGLEKEHAVSYWRNETLGQPSLDQPQRTYLVSGQGDGAMIDLLRLRISQYRQDRILEELFHGRNNLNAALRILYHEFAIDKNKTGLFEKLEMLGSRADTEAEFLGVLNLLARRLRRDTEVVLHWKVRKLSELFDQPDTRISFQNRVLIFLLYKCGGFSPTSEPEPSLKERLAIPDACIVRRYGPDPLKQLQGVLSPGLFDVVERQSKAAGFRQSDSQEWPGGYFGFPGRSDETERIGDDLRRVWRKEYLPGAVVLLATGFCAAIAGDLKARRPGLKVRVTLHRSVKFPSDELLQQACDYQGVEKAGPGTEATAGRTFPAGNATIGLAFKCRRIIRSKKVNSAALREAMRRLNIHAAASTMSNDVEFLLAMPILEPEEPSRFTEPSPVAGVVYIDSETPGFYIEDEELIRLVSMAQHLVHGLERVPQAASDRIRNVPLSGLATDVPARESLPVEVGGELEVVGVDPPRTSGPFQFNHDYSDFVPIQGWPQ